jgi:RNAse (barnase) inhibitor barstar
MSGKPKNSGLKKLSGINLTTAPIEQFEQAADALGWRLIALDGSDVSDKDGFLELCANAFGLPEWFGMNWDALDECLTEIDLETPGLVVLWSSWSEFAQADPEEFATAVDVLRTAAGVWADDGVKGGVLLVGDGPQIDVPAL